MLTYHDMSSWQLISIAWQYNVYWFHKWLMTWMTKKCGTSVACSEHICKSYILQADNKYFHVIFSTMIMCHVWFMLIVRYLIVICYMLINPSPKCYNKDYGTSHVVKKSVNSYFLPLHFLQHYPDCRLKQ